jgi:hypothetical protein
VKRFTAVFEGWYPDAPPRVLMAPTDDVLSTVSFTGRSGRASAACSAAREGRNVPRMFTSHAFHHSAGSDSWMRTEWWR